MFAALLLIAAFAQNPGSPIEVTGQIAPVSQTFAGAEPGPGLYMTVRNTSQQGIRGYVFTTSFTDPSTGKGLGGRHQHSGYASDSRGVIAPGGSITNPKPYQLPATSSGAVAQFTFTVDLVVFDDGSMWGPAQTRAAQQLLAEHPPAR